MNEPKYDLGFRAIDGNGNEWRITRRECTIATGNVEYGITLVNHKTELFFDEQTLELLFIVIEPNYQRLNDEARQS